MTLNEKEAVYCFANVGLSVCLSVDHMVSADYFEFIYHKVCILYLVIGHNLWMTPIEFGMTRPNRENKNQGQGQGHRGLEWEYGFRLVSW
jgi:hypothetical protein